MNINRYCIKNVLIYLMLCDTICSTIQKGVWSTVDNLKFHNVVGLKLERMTKEQGTKTFTADEIDGGEFIDAMLNVLGVDPKQLNSYSEFFSKCTEYHGKKKLDIPDNEAMALFDVFETIINR